MSAGAQAQTTGGAASPSSSGDSGMRSSSIPVTAGSERTDSRWYAPAGGRYIGFNAGRSDFGGNCGLSNLFACNNDAAVYNLYTGAMHNQNLGVEFGVTDFGRISRAGGTTKAYGFNASLVGRIPVTESFAVFGKLGLMYGRTNVSALPASGVATGTNSGFGPTYGAGVSFDINPQLAAVVQFDQTHLKFAGGREHINTASVGLKYRF